MWTTTKMRLDKSNIFGSFTILEYANTQRWAQANWKLFIPKIL